MVAPVTASERDLRALARIVSEERTEVPTKEGLPPSLLADLMGQIRCDFLSFYGLDTGRKTTWFDQDFPVDCDDDEIYDRTFWTYYWDFATSYPDRSGDLRSVTKRSDFYSLRELRSTAMYSDYIRPLGLEYVLRLYLPAGPKRTVRLAFFRDSVPDFSERDRAVLTLLRPHLHQAYLDTERRRHPVPRLTPRQWELLRLLAGGHTNTQIARRLGISEGTVRTHLENIYTRLNVSSRTAAVTRAFPGR